MRNASTRIPYDTPIKKKCRGSMQSVFCVTLPTERPCGETPANAPAPGVSSPNSQTYKNKYFPTMIRSVSPDDAAQIAGIYNHYIEQTTITFETEPVSETEIRQRIETIASHYPYWVEEQDGRITGYCYAHQWKEKKAYQYTAETTVYVHPDHLRQGTGRRLMTTLLASCREKGLHNLIACITYPNAASVRLHEQLGFRQASRFHEVGRKFGQWLDIYDFECRLLENEE